MLRVGAKYQQLTCDASCCFESAQKRDAMFSRRRSFVAAGIAAAIAPPSVLSNNPADVPTSVNLKKVTVALARRSRRCDQWRRSAAKIVFKDIDQIRSWTASGDQYHKTP
jgi:hypothetical protein